MENPSEFIKLASSAAKEAAKIIMKARGKAKIVKYKGEGDFAVDADHKSENKIMAMIQKKYPTHNILTEETGKINKGSEYTWVIDPIDGTLNFKHGLPLFAISIALLKNEKPIVSVIYAPALKEFFHAVKGKGAFLNGKRIHVSSTKKVSDGLYDGSVFNLCLIKNKLEYHTARGLGSTALGLAYVACGRLTARIRVRRISDPYSNAAGVLLITEAGGLVTKNDGKPCDIYSKNIIASNKRVHKKLVQLLKK